MDFASRLKTLQGLPTALRRKQSCLPVQAPVPQQCPLRGLLKQQAHMASAFTALPTSLYLATAYQCSANVSLFQSGLPCSIDPQGVSLLFSSTLQHSIYFLRSIYHTLKSHIYLQEHLIPVSLCNP